MTIIYIELSPENYLTNFNMASTLKGKFELKNEVQQIQGN